MADITDVLFRLIDESVADDKKRLDNLEKIQLLLNHSREYKKLGIKDLEINEHIDDPKDTGL